MPRLRLRLSPRLTALLAHLFVLGLLGLSVASVATYGAIHYTAQSEFCSSCHIMDSYYASWQDSSHSEVACIECHYQPGAVETFEGKFEALSQVAKYVTRTQGTKPWAEVADQSCLRSGCHAVPDLEGTVMFGEVAFDHRPHLLDTRPGEKLRCVTCHSQSVQGEHISVSTSVCITCHFMPDRDGASPARSSECLKCHCSPQAALEVAGRPFLHSAYVERGVDCRECHDPVIEGQGKVRPERCLSCHGELDKVSRLAETVFLHDMHITANKVECFQCHDEMHHGLVAPTGPGPSSREGCGACHVSTHEAVRSLYTGSGATGVPDQPSRMHETHVGCRACHTGRSGAPAAAAGERPRAHGEAGTAHPAGHSAIAAAGNVDCIHCHGTGFDGMLARWQDSVGGELERLRPLLVELESSLPAVPEESLARALGEARRNLELVALDGSRGAHNVTYALASLRACAERMDGVREALGLAADAPLAADSPFLSADGCSTCHAGLEAPPAARSAGPGFSHGPHLRRAGLECSACHSTARHGAPAAERLDCASCHHGPASGRDPSDCGACHAGQAALLAGNAPGHAELPTGMSEMDCYECHGDAPEILRPGPAMCVLCHEPGFDRLMTQWQGAVAGRLERLEAARGQLGVQVSPSASELLERSRAESLPVQRDGSGGVHNIALALDLLQAAATLHDQAALQLEPPAPTLDEPAPFRSEDGCMACHAGLETRFTPDQRGRTFPHARHVGGAGMDCGACHSVAEHKQPAFPREQCASCHHASSAAVPDPDDCQTCHVAQQRMLLGELEGFADLPGAKADMDCTDCHGEAGDLALPPAALCAMCHESGFEERLPGLAAEIDDRRAHLVELLATRPASDGEAMRARRALQAVIDDGSRGVHNHEFARSILEESLQRLQGD